jgi:GNAT superfamily N-acetyltransferase
VSFLKEVLTKALNKLKSSGLDPCHIKVSVTTHVDLAGWLGESEPSDSINQYYADIELYLDDNFEQKVSIGYAICFYISGYDWANEDFSDIHEIADSLSGDLLTAALPVLDQDGSLSDEYFSGSFLYIDEFFIQPEYRDKGIGTVVFPSLLDTLGRGAGAIAIIPTPTDDDGKTRINDNNPRFQVTLNQMYKFIMKFGFFCSDRGNRVWIKNTARAD